MAHRRRARGIVFCLLALGLLLIPQGIASARWAVIADHAVDPIRVCTDGIAFSYAANFYNDGQDYSADPRTIQSRFKAAFPVPEEDLINGGYVYPAPGTIIADHAFTSYKFSGQPWGIDTSDPPDGVDDGFLVYQGMSAVKWSQPRTPGDEVLLTFLDFSSNEISPIVTVEDCRVFQIDINPGLKSPRVNLASKKPLEVAILKDASFNPFDIDKASVRFGRTGTEAKAISWRWQDIDRDGDVDLIFKFDIAKLKLDCGSTAAFMSAQSTNGDFFAADAVTPTGCRWPFR